MAAASYFALSSLLAVMGGFAAGAISDRLGLQNIAYGGGATLGPFLAGALFDLFGNYTLAFVLIGASSVASSIIVSTASVAGRAGSWAAKRDVR